MIYLDYAATTPLSPRISDLIKDRNIDLFGNNSSPHIAGKESSEALEHARDKLAELFKVDSHGMYFTSGATESINLLFQGLAKLLQRSKSERNEMIISQIEHPAVYQTAHYLGSQGFIVHELKNDEYGIVDVNDLKDKINKNTALVAIMAVNNETGTIQDISSLAKSIKDLDEKILFFSDTVQALGKINTESITTVVDSFCGSAHKVGGPKGVGFLYLNPKFRILPLVYGGDQELSLRPGTTNVPGIDLMREAFSDRVKNLSNNYSKVTEINTHLESKLTESSIDFNRIVPLKDSSPYIFSMSLPINNDRLLERLSEKGVCISKRSACSSQSHTKSRILESMGILHDEIDRIVRISFSPETTTDELDQFVMILRGIL